MRRDIKPALVILAVLILLLPPMASIRQDISKFLRPVATQLYKLGVATSPFLPSKNDGSKITQLEAELLRTRRENEQLRKQLSFVEGTSLKAIGADVIGRSSVASERVVRLNRGQQDGVRLGAAVIFDGYLVGKVSAVTESSSDVLLVTDPTFRITATVENVQTPGLAIGGLGGMRLERIPVGEKLVRGSTVFSSDIGGEVPNGLPIGVVAGFRNLDDLFYEIDIDTPVFIESSQIMMIVIS